MKIITFKNRSLLILIALFTLGTIFYINNSLNRIITEEAGFHDEKAITGNFFCWLKIYFKCKMRFSLALRN